MIVHAYMRTHYMQAPAHLHTHAYTRTHLHTHTNTHTPIHTHSHTHACMIRTNCDKCNKPISTRWNLELLCQRAHSHSTSVRAVIDPENWLPPENLFEGLDGPGCETSGLLFVAVSWLQCPCPVCKRHPALSSSQTPGASERRPRLKNRNPAPVLAAPCGALSRRGRYRHPLPGPYPVAVSWNPFPAHLFRQPPQAVWHELRR